MSISELFEKHEDEYLRFERVESPMHKRPDLSAFLLLSEIMPESKRDMISAAGHDEIWLDVDVEELEKLATEDQIITLIRCGIHLDDESLAMFV